jgi:hypothetical protein
VDVVDIRPAVFHVELLRVFHVEHSKRFAEEQDPGPLSWKDMPLPRYFCAYRGADGVAYGLVLLSAHQEHQASSRGELKSGGRDHRAEPIHGTHGH